MKPKRKRKDRIDKKTCQLLHFYGRVKERHRGITPNIQLVRIIVKKIQDGASVFVEKQSHRISVHDVWVNGEQLRVVYDGERKIPVTVLPWWNDQRGARGGGVQAASF